MGLRRGYQDTVKWEVVWYRVSGRGRVRGVAG